MKPFCEALIVALRSNTYTQIVDHLTDGRGGHCVMGVACAIGGATLHLDTYDGQWGLAPLSITERLGLTVDQIATIMDMNDNRVPFDEIALYLETLP